MAKFTIRVQLMVDPSSEEYDQLHAEMSALGYERTVQGKDRLVHLPHALYYGASEDSASVVCTSVAKRVRTIQPKVKVFVAETRTWAAM